MHLNLVWFLSSLPQDTEWLQQYNSIKRNASSCIIHTVSSSNQSNVCRNSIHSFDTIQMIKKSDFLHQYTIPSYPLWSLRRHRRRRHQHTLQKENVLKHAISAVTNQQKKYHRRRAPTTMTKSMWRDIHRYQRNDGNRMNGWCIIDGKMRSIKSHQTLNTRTIVKNRDIIKISGLSKRDFQKSAPWMTNRIIQGRNHLHKQQLLLDYLLHHHHHYHHHPHQHHFYQRHHHRSQQKQKHQTQLIASAAATTAAALSARHQPDTTRNPQQFTCHTQTSTMTIHHAANINIELIALNLSAMLTVHAATSKITSSNNTTNTASTTTTTAATTKQMTVNNNNSFVKYHQLPLLLMMLMMFVALMKLNEQLNHPNVGNGIFIKRMWRRLASLDNINGVSVAAAAVILCRLSVKSTNLYEQFCQHYCSSICFHYSMQVSAINIILHSQNHIFVETICIAYFLMENP